MTDQFGSFITNTLVCAVSADAFAIENRTKSRKSPLADAVPRWPTSQSPSHSQVAIFSIPPNACSLQQRKTNQRRQTENRAYPHTAILDKCGPDERCDKKRNDEEPAKQFEPEGKQLIPDSFLRVSRKFSPIHHCNENQRGAICEDGDTCREKLHTFSEL